MSEQEKYLDRQGVSHFYIIIKNKLTSYFESIFVKQKEGYGLSKNNFTDELKDKLISIPGVGESISEDDVIFVRANINEETAELLIDDENKQIIVDYLNSNSDKCLVLILENVNAYLYYSAWQFACIVDGSMCEILVSVSNNENEEITIDHLNLEISTKNFVISDEIKGAQESYNDNDVLNFNGVSSYFDKRISDLGVYEEVIEGYYNEDDGMFYADINFSEEINGETSKLYIDLSSNHSFRFGGSIFVKLESSVGLSALTNEEIDNIINSAEESIK